jgi:1-acyl-sn-glycerol-3-phosphate acyltransferase
MTRFLRFLFFGVLVRGVILLGLGLTVRHRDRLPRKGPAIIAANHNSHLDTLALMSLLPLQLLPKLRPVAAADYFLSGKIRSWFARDIVGIIPLTRAQTRKDANPLADLAAALDRGEILILFPEGSRGEPEALGRFKTGLGQLAATCPGVPVTPVYMHGFGKALPRGSSLLVPFNCTVSVGEALYGRDFVGSEQAGAQARRAFMSAYEARISDLAAAETVPDWD